MLLMNSPQVTPTLTTSAMSLAILPSNPVIYGQNAAPTLLPAAPPAKKPKLSLNTTSLPSTFGKGSTSLRLETLSATSPTVRNTFRNAYPLHQGNQPFSRQKPTLSPLVTNVAISDKRLPTPLRTDLNLSTELGEVPSSSPSASSLTSASTIDSLPTPIPYKLAYNVASILKNGPLPRRIIMAHHKAMFPPAKKVSFRTPLTETVQNTKYMIRHSDIDSSTSTISTLELPPPAHGTTAEDDEQMAGQDGHTANAQDKPSPTSPQTGEKRESSDEEDSDTCPATPVAGRRKRNRIWRWTLAPVETADQQAPSAANVDRVQEASSGASHDNPENKDTGS